MNDEPLSDDGHPRRFSRLALLAGALLLIAVLSGIWSALAFKMSSETVDRARETVVRIEHLLSSVKDLETGQRGFVLTGEDSYLEPYDSAIRLIDPN